MSSATAGTDTGKKSLKRADPSTIQDKFLVGYQGWFTCGGDGEPVGPGHHGWLHWFNCPIPDDGHPNIDLWPDVSSYSPSELFPAPGLMTRSGEQAFLFSSRHPKTVQRHFHWMAEHGVDGAFLQRFASECDLEAGSGGIMRIRDEVGDRVKEAAEKEGRVFAIMYDVSGVAPNRIKGILERDWLHLIHSQGILDSPNYLKEKGKSVVALWGFGFDNAGHTPELVQSITNYIRRVTPGGVYIMAGTPAHWRTAESDADRNPQFLDVWLNEFDAISPWTVGRYTDEQGADNFAETRMRGDVELIKKRNVERLRKIDYIPVVLPGGSGFNLSQGKWSFNGIKRKGGRFLWKQISNAKRLDVRIMYGAMWDEYDEGTAFMPVVENKRMLPQSDKYQFMALDEDGYDLPSDWYMRICGFAAEGLRSERRIHDTFPIKELLDYWASRPKYEEVEHKHDVFVSESLEMPGKSGSGQGSQSYQNWLPAQKEVNEEVPPPYSLEAEEVSAKQPQCNPTDAVLTLSTPSASNRTGTSSLVALSSTRVPLSETTQAPLVSPRVEGSPTSSSQVLASARPPLIKMSSRPEQSYTPSQYPLQHSHTISQYSVSSLTNDFARHGIVTQPRPSNHSTPPPRPHSAHPVAPHSPGPHLPIHSRPLVHSLTYSHSHSRLGSPSGGSHHMPPVIGVSSTQESQGLHSPDLDIGKTSQMQPARPSTSPENNAGAHSPQLQTFGSSQYSPPASLSPHGSLSIPRPQSTPGASHGPSHEPGYVKPSQFYGSSPPFPGRVSPFPGSGASSYDTPSDSAMPSFPSGFNQPLYPSVGPSSGQEGLSSYPVQPTYSPYGKNYLNTPIHESRPHSPHLPSPPPLPSFPNGSYQPSTFPAGQGPTYSGQSYGPLSAASQYPLTSYDSPYDGYSPGIGTPQGEAIYFPSAHTPPFQTVQSPQISPYSHNYSPISFPGSSTALPRPPSHPSSYEYQPPSGPSTSTGPIGFALNAVDKVAGKKVRKQLESGVESLTQTGSLGKIFSKLTK